MEEREDSLTKRCVLVFCIEVTAAEFLALHVAFRTEDSVNMSNVICHGKYCEDEKFP